MATFAVVDNAFLAVVSHQLLVGLRKELKIDVLTEAYAGTGQIGFLGWLRADALVARASAFDITVIILQCASAPRTGCCRPHAPPPGGKMSGAGAFRAAPGSPGACSRTVCRSSSAATPLPTVMTINPGQAPATWFQTDPNSFTGYPERIAWNRPG